MVTPFTALQAKITKAEENILLPSPQAAFKNGMKSALRAQETLILDVEPLGPNVLHHQPSFPPISETSPPSPPSFLDPLKSPTDREDGFSLLEKLEELKAKLREEFAESRNNLSSKTGADPPPPSPIDTENGTLCEIQAERSLQPDVSVPQTTVQITVQTATPSKLKIAKKAKKKTKTKKKKKPQNELELLAYFDPGNTLVKIVEKQKNAPKTKPRPPKCSTPVRKKTLQRPPSSSPPPSTSSNNFAFKATLASPDAATAPKTDLERQLKSQLTRRNTQIEMLKNQVRAVVIRTFFNRIHTYLMNNPLLYLALLVAHIAAHRVR